MENPPKFHNRYRPGSIRHKNWDYAAAGYYFVTICTRDKKPYFGRIREEGMVLDGWGHMAENLWKEIPLHFPRIRLDEFIFMPNHLHGILIIDTGEPGWESDDSLVETRHCLVSEHAPHSDLRSDIASASKRDEINLLPGETTKTRQCLVSTENAEVRRLHNQGKGTLSAIVGAYKSICARTIRPLAPDFAWQRNFYDRIIRNEKELDNIRRYIQGNPLKWKDDKYFHE
jgi:REP element-mobilizing transposase RayT